MSSRSLLRLDGRNQVLRIASSREMCRTSRNGHGDLVETVVPTDTSSVRDRSAGSASAGDAIVGYRAFVAVVVAAYFTFIALTPRQSWVPAWPDWLRNIALATAAVVFVVVYVGVAQREREARQRAEALSAEVAQLATANERNRMAREIHDTLGHYLTVIHVQLEAARAVLGTDANRGILAVSRAQRRAKDGLAAVRQSVTALREDARVEGLAEQIASLVDSVRDERFSATFKTSGKPRPVSAAIALALHRSTLEALTNVRKHVDAAGVEIELAFHANGRVPLRVEDDGKGAADDTGGTGFGLKGVR